MASEKQVEDGWTEERIAAKVREVSHVDIPDMRTRSVTEFQAQQLMGLVWSDCQRTIAALRATLEFAAQYKGIEGRACPLCEYVNGEFIETCQMHKDMDALRVQIERLKAQVNQLHETIGKQTVDATRDGWRIATLETELELIRAQRRAESEG